MTIAGRAIRVIDMHADCVIPVTDIVRGSADCANNKKPSEYLRSQI